MDYEKAYKEVLSRAKTKYDSMIKQGVVGMAENIAELFPELKESEDERIRKTLIHIVKGACSNYGIKYQGKEIGEEKLLAWLEKQGEQKEYPKDVIDNAISFLANRNDGMPKEVAKDIVNAIITVLNPSCWPKQGEQKEQREHVWTLQDAAPGDILNSTRVQATIIFKGFNPDGKHIDAYCALQKGIFIHQELPWDMDWEPAPIFWIVELFRRMNESGYMWNPEKEELVNIKQSSADKVEQNPAWGEEDKKMIGRIRVIIEKYAFSQSAVDVNGDLCEREFIEPDEWLRTLKDRCTWKPSDEQMSQLECVAKQNKDNMLGKELMTLFNDLKRLLKI